MSKASPSPLACLPPLESTSLTTWLTAARLLFGADGGGHDAPLRAAMHTALWRHAAGTSSAEVAAAVTTLPSIVGSVLSVYREEALRRLPGATALDIVQDDADLHRAWAMFAPLLAGRGVAVDLGLVSASHARYTTWSNFGPGSLEIRVAARLDDASVGAARRTFVVSNDFVGVMAARRWLIRVLWQAKWIAPGTARAELAQVPAVGRRLTPPPSAMPTPPMAVLSSVST